MFAAIWKHIFITTARFKVVKTDLEAFFQDRLLFFLKKKGGKESDLFSFFFYGPSFKTDHYTRVSMTASCQVVCRLKKREPVEKRRRRGNKRNSFWYPWDPLLSRRNDHTSAGNRSAEKELSILLLSNTCFLFFEWKRSFSFRNDQQE